MKWCLFVLVGAAPLLGQQCTYTVSPTAINVTANGGMNSINVSTSSRDLHVGLFHRFPTWITLSAPGAANNSVTGGGVLTVTALASSLPTARTGKRLHPVRRRHSEHHGKSGTRAVFHDAATRLGDASRVRRNQQLWGSDIVYLGRHQQCALDLGRTARTVEVRLPPALPLSAEREMAQ